MHRRTFIAGLVLLLLATLVAACAKPAEQPKPAEPAQPAEQPKEINVGFIYVGPVGDAGWTWAHDQGRQYLEKNLAGVKTFYVESVPEGADCEREIRRLVEEKNCKVVFTTSFGFMDGTLNVAKEYPDRVFMHCSGYKMADNMGNYFGRMYQPRYLAGIVAGKMTKSSKIGYVAAFSIPEVVRGINAFTLGVRSVNPKATVRVIWTNTWYDPAKEKEAAKSLLAVGCDVIAQHQDTPGPQQAAEEAGKYGVGYNCDMSKFAPKAHLTAPVWNWGPYYLRVVKAVMDGTWKPEAYWGPMSDGVVGLAPFGPMVPDDVKKLVEDKKQEIVSGKWDVFTGPIKDQSGKVRVAEGQKMTDQEMLSFDWFVQGVEGTIK
ncbi:MAG: BMP family ABC transporter substrate-binding protein [Bacillota bacterium]|nr:BMP family ABC transporter substrate-binding protein [Bacillota bacterium]